MATLTFILCVATAVTIVQGVGVQQGDVRSDEPLGSKYSCANPVMEIVERIARILFIVSNSCINSYHLFYALAINLYNQLQVLPT